jgi:hypothetical protein
MAERVFLAPSVIWPLPDEGAMKVCWVSIQTEAEKDVFASCSRAGINCIMFAYGERSSVQRPEGQADLGSVTPVELLRLAIAEKPDLLVLRYPSWCPSEVAEVLRGVRSVVFLSEQGASRRHAVSAAARFATLGVGSSVDVDFYRHRFPNKKVIRFPFGCFASSTLAEPGNLDVVCASTPHHACFAIPCGGDDDPTAKRESVDILVRPLIGRNMDVWGPAAAENNCGWNRVDWAREHFRGWREDIEVVERSAKLALGITWNWRMGGYGMKLAKLLGHGGPAVLWHRTNAMERDGLVEGVHLLSTSSQEETIEKADLLLTNEVYRRTIAEAGWRFAQEHLEWATILTTAANQLG